MCNSKFFRVCTVNDRYKSINNNNNHNNIYTDRNSAMSLTEDNPQSIAAIHQMTDTNAQKRVCFV